MKTNTELCVLCAESAFPFEEEQSRTAERILGRMQLLAGKIISREAGLTAPPPPTTREITVGDREKFS
jgi:hypothetical protein